MKIVRLCLWLEPVELERAEFITKPLAIIYRMLDLSTRQRIGVLLKDAHIYVYEEVDLLPALLESVVAFGLLVCCYKQSI